MQRKFLSNKVFDFKMLFVMVLGFYDYSGRNSVYSMFIIHANHLAEYFNLFERKKCKINTAALVKRSNVLLLGRVRKEIWYCYWC